MPKLAFFFLMKLKPRIVHPIFKAFVVMQLVRIQCLSDVALCIDLAISCSIAKYLNIRKKRSKQKKKRTNTEP